MEPRRTYTSFAGTRRIVTGDLEAMLRRTKAKLDKGERATVLVFDDESGAQVDFDFTGSVEDVLARVEEPPRAGPGRPKLGVVSREVSLLPRHWEWLEAQPQGISATLRRLVEAAKKHAPAAERARRSQAAAGKFMWSMAGNLSGFEEASRALFAGEKARFKRLIRRWPADVRAHTERLAHAAFEATS